MFQGLQQAQDSNLQSWLKPYYIFEDYACCKNSSKKRLFINGNLNFGININSMKVHHLLMLTAMLVIAISSSGFDFDLNNCKVEKYDAWDVLTFPCSGGSGYYDYTFQKLPVGWYSNKDKIYAPKQKIDSNKYYGVKVTVFDNVNKSYLKKSLVFNLIDQKISALFDTGFDFDYEDESNVKALIRNKNVGRISRPIPIATPVLISNNLFPSQAEITALIVSGNVVQIRTIINTVIRSNYNCRIVSKYLSGLLTQIQVQISILRANVQSTQQEIVTIQAELSFLIAELDKLGSNSFNAGTLQSQLTAFQAELSVTIKQKSALEIEYSQYQIQVQQYEAEIYQIKSETIAVAHNNVELEHQRLSSIDIQIQDLQAKLKQLRIERESVVQNVNKYDLIISQGQERIRGVQVKIRNVQFSINSIRVRISRTTEIIATLNIKITQIQQQINLGGFGNQQQINQINRKVENLRQQINIKNTEVKQIQFVIVTLDGSMAQFNQIINSQYYSCYQIIDGNGGAGSGFGGGNGNGEFSGNGGAGGGYGGGNGGIIGGNGGVGGGFGGGNGGFGGNGGIIGGNGGVGGGFGGGNGNGGIIGGNGGVGGGYGGGNGNGGGFGGGNGNGGGVGGGFGGGNGNGGTNGGNGGVGGGFGGGNGNVDNGSGCGFVAVTPYNAFLNYLKQVYGAVPNPNIRSRFSGNLINLKYSSIFSPSWTKVYGIPYSAGYGNNMDIMENQFSCENVSDAKVFTGRIKGITSNVINVQASNGDSYIVHLGGCTRLQTSTGRDIPQIGDQIYWKGVATNPKSRNEYNGYHITCY